VLQSLFMSDNSVIGTLGNLSAMCYLLVKNKYEHRSHTFLFISFTEVFQHIYRMKFGRIILFEGTFYLIPKDLVKVLSK
jgi:hypothetical protein